MVKKLIVILSIIGFVVLVGVGGYFWQKQTNQPTYETFSVKLGELKQEVSATGEVTPSSEVALGFEISGKVLAVLADVDDKVEKNQSIVRLNANELQAQLNQAQANLEKDTANLSQLQQGASQAELAVLETKVANAKTTLADKEIDLTKTNQKAVVDLNNAYIASYDDMLSSYATADDTLNKQIDDLFINDNTASPILSFSTANSQQAQNTENQRVSAGTALNDLKQITQNLPTEQNQIDQALNHTELHLTFIKNFLNQLSDSLNNSIGLTSVTLTAYKGYVNTARSNTNTSLAAINTQKQTIAAQKVTNQSNIATAQSAVNTAKSALDLAQKDLALKKAGATEQEIKAQEAQVKAAVANVANLQAKINKTVLRAPIAGVITKQLAKVGENISANVVLVQIITQNQLEVEALISEVDIVKVATGQTAEITLDAFGDEVVFPSEVISVEPSQTVIQDVVYYKVKLAFTQENQNIKPGMTANISIYTDKKENVLYVPSRAVKATNGDKYVEVLVNKKPEKRIVQTGIRGNEGLEITSGLNEGELVITFTNTK